MQLADAGRAILSTRRMTRGVPSQAQATAVARATLTAAEVGSWLAPGRVQGGAMKR